MKLTVYDIKATYIPVREIDEVQISTAFQLYDYMKDAFNEYPMQEQFWVILLNGNNIPIGRKMITLGIANQTQIHPREAFSFAVREGAISVIFAHNHPSGNSTESDDDIKVTERLIKAGKLLDIPVLDHIIITDFGYNAIRATNPAMFY